jgi:hypothetical protein
MPATARPENARRSRHELGEDDRPRARFERVVGWAVVVVATWLVFNTLDAHHDWGIGFRGRFLPIPRFDLGEFRFGDLFLNTTTNGGDMGAHVWWPNFLAENWFGKLRLSGWAPDWYAGFPVGHYYFPLPAVMVAVLDLVPFVPYNVAFKLVTVSGPVMLPAAAYAFARGMRAPWPAPPAFAVAALGTLMQTRDDWQIYGGNIASTLAGEFSFTIGLAFALFGLGALAYTLDTGKRRWLPAALIAASALSHVVVAIITAIAAVLLWVTRRPRRTFPLAAAIGAVAIALPMVWLLPLLAGHSYTQSMRYTKVVPHQTFTLSTWLDVPTWLPFHGFFKDHLTGPVRHTINHFWSALGTYVDPNTNKEAMQPLWLPWWIWTLGFVAIVAGAWYRRRSTLVLLVFALVLGGMFVQWPEHAIWNTRFLPFWLLAWGFLAAMGATELLRLAASAVSWAYRWVRDGDLQDARARAWAELATADEAAVDPEVRKEAAWALAGRRFDTDPAGWEPPADLAPAAVEARSRRIGAIALAVFVAFAGVVALNRAWVARGGNPKIAIAGWAAWNYEGYEKKAAYPQYKAIIDGMDDVARTHGNGRALWEPSSGEPDAINSYGTSLALELLPHFTDGRVGSMEGIYFESSATTSYHFLTVAECARHPSNPVRGLDYGTLDEDFDLCVRHLQMLGVRYLMLWTDDANEKAADHDELTLVKVIPQNPPIDGPSQSKLREWRVYQVAGSDLVVPMDVEPVVAKVRGGSYSTCWGEDYSDPSHEPKLGAWECTVAPWWRDRALLDVPFTQSGPKDWQRADGRDLGAVQPRRIRPTTVTDVRRSVDEISFRVAETGKPVLVRESFFPNWQVRGAEGPYRIAPNLMVVVPTDDEVTLHYGLTRVDWLGRVLSLAGLLGLVWLGRWAGGRRFAAYGTGETGGDAGGAGDGDGDGAPDRPGDDDVPPDRREPAPALP